MEGPLAALTRDGQRRAEGHWIGRSLLLRVHGPEAGPALARAAEDAGAEVADAGDAGEPLFLLHGTLPERVLCDAIEGAGGVVLPPLAWERGEARIAALALAPGVAQAVQRAVPQATLARKQLAREGEDAHALLREGLGLPRLTRRQAEAVLAALDAGYYDLPRKVTTLEVARARGLARSTFEEHLKRAEAQLIGAMAPLARLRLAEEGAAQGGAVEWYARFSAALGLYVTLAVRGDRVACVRLARAPAPDAGGEHPYLARILEHLATGKGKLSDLPLDLEVSPFERKVLDALRAIPPGTTMTYGEVARRIGQPGAARAVGQACARNPALLVIPCHRVVPGNGALGNYAGEGGAATKAKLLAIEGAAPQPARKKRKPAAHRSAPRDARAAAGPRAKA
jgi:methylated-DNA-[protein]-cysteine S-methyltransferase